MYRQLVLDTETTGLRIEDGHRVIEIACVELLILNLPENGFLHKLITDYCKIIDTLQIARQLHVGQRNNLDALCKRYGIDNSKRDLHGALLDAHLLAQVYLAMTGGQGSFFDGLSEHPAQASDTEISFAPPIQKYNLVVLKSSAEEKYEHKKYLDLLKQQGKCLWQEGEQ